MTQATAPFAVAGPIAPRLEAVLSYWQDLRRGAADVPFWDDVSLPQVRELCGELFLIDVFARPERFRLNDVEVGLAREDLDEVLGRFIDEVELDAPFEMLRAQCSATVEAMRPTVYAHEPDAIGEVAYERLLLPLWGEGEVRMLLGAVERR